MRHSDWLIVVGLIMIPLLGLISYRRLGRAAVPLTLLAVMAATGSMFWATEWTVDVIGTVDRVRHSNIWFAVANHPLWFFFDWQLPHILGVIVILWLILAIRRLPPWT